MENLIDRKIKKKVFFFFLKWESANMSERMKKSLLTKSQRVRNKWDTLFKFKIEGRAQQY